MRKHPPLRSTALVPTRANETCDDARRKVCDHVDLAWLRQHEGRLRRQQAAPRSRVVRIAPRTRSLVERAPSHAQPGAPDRVATPGSDRVRRRRRRRVRGRGRNREGCRRRKRTDSSDGRSRDWTPTRVIRVLPHPAVLHSFSVMRDGGIGVSSRLRRRLAPCRVVQGFEAFGEPSDAHSPTHAPHPRNRAPPEPHPQDHHPNTRREPRASRERDETCERGSRDARRARRGAGSRSLGRSTRQEAKPPSNHRTAIPITASHPWRDGGDASSEAPEVKGDAQHSGTQ